MKEEKKKKKKKNMATTKLLQNTLMKLSKEPVEGFVCELLDDSDLFKWKVYLEGPKDTPYEGGIFYLQMSFPPDYPMSPPSLTFISEFWHPNVYPDGKVCISILHPPGEDEMSGELPEERWNPTQTVSTILLSVISMLGDPNISSPANVNASVQWRKEREAYNRKCRELAEKARKAAPPDIKIPHPDSDPFEREETIQKQKAADNDDFDMCSYDDFEDDLRDDDDVDEEEENGEDEGDDEEDEIEEEKKAEKEEKQKEQEKEKEKDKGKGMDIDVESETKPIVERSNSKRKFTEVDDQEKSVSESLEMTVQKGKEAEETTSSPASDSSSSSSSTTTTTTTQEAKTSPIEPESTSSSSSSVSPSSSTSPPSSSSSTTISSSSPSKAEKKRRKACDMM